MAGIFWYIEAIINALAINDAGDSLEINDSGDLLEY